jgi:hypothetical protein
MKLVKFKDHLSPFSDIYINSNFVISVGPDAAEGTTRIDVYGNEDCYEVVRCDQETTVRLLETASNE